MAVATESLNPDGELVDIARYVCDYRIESADALAAARRCLLDTIACALYALSYPECTKLMGPLVPGATLRNGARVPGTSYQLDPATAAFSTGTALRWLDMSDGFLAAQGSHPSDNLAGILSTADYLSRARSAVGEPPLVMRDVLHALIKAYEIQGCLSLENDFNASALDHVILTRVSTAAVVARMLGGDADVVLSAVSNAWLEMDLRVYRHDPGTGPRKGWAAANASAQGVRLALMAAKGEPGYPCVLSAAEWGFYDVYRGGKPFRFQRPYGEYIIRQVTLKASAACMHAQSAVECGVCLHPLVRDRLNDIERIDIFSHRALMGIIDKTGPLRNPADRDHCARYIVAVALIFGRLNPADFEDTVASDPRIDALRGKMRIIEDPAFTRDYYDPQKRANGNGLKVYFRDGTSTQRIDVEFPPGHPRRRAETAEIFRTKLLDALALRYPRLQRDRILEACDDNARLDAMPVHAFMDLLAT